MSNSLQLAHHWWATLNPAGRPRVWDTRYSYFVESMAKAGMPVVSDGRWSCVTVRPTGFTVPVAVKQLLQGLPQIPPETIQPETRRGLSITPCGR